MTDEVSTPTTYEEETRGYAITAMTLAWGALSFLRNRDIIDNDGVREILEDALNGPEALFPVGDRPRHSFQMRLRPGWGFKLDREVSEWTCERRRVREVGQIQ